VERLTGSDGETLERYEYEGYGEFRIFAGEASLANSAYGWRWLFQGREHLPKLGAYDFRARTLWPEFGRFGQEDPLGAVDSSNLYQAFVGAPESNIDPLGTIVVDAAVSGSRRYRAVRASFLLSPLGSYVWNEFAASGWFTLTFTTTNDTRTSAVTSRIYDASGKYNAAEISVGPRFGQEPDPEPWYAKGRAIYANEPRADPRNVYTMGHEIGHVMYGLDPTKAANALLINTINAQMSPITTQMNPLVRILARHRTTAQARQLAQLQAQLAPLEATGRTLKAATETYADLIGELFYFSYRAAHPARGIRIPPGPFNVPAGSVP
jgi:RHS repeat-associated protein